MAGRLGTPWHLIIDPRGRTGPENMASDEGLLRAAQSGEGTFLRLYRWAEPGCLSFGRNEPASRRFDRTALAAHGWPVVRRPTGGRAVWHEHELTYAVAAPIAQWGSLAASHRVVHELLAEALRTLGVAAVLAPAKRDVAHGPCFATAVGGEIVVNGLKVVGSAQVREGQAFLQHGSILLDGSQDPVRQVSITPGPPVPSTTLGAVLGRPVQFAEAAAAVARRALAVWGPPETSDRALPTPSLARYSSDDWTWRR